MKKTFDCGHVGKGKFCHRCSDAQRVQLRQAEQLRSEQEEKAQVEAARTRAREDKHALAKSDVIDLSTLSHLPVLQKKARQIIAAMADGASYFEFGGKRLESMKREILSIPIGDRFRLIYRVNPMTPVECISHESYNPKYVG